MSECFQKCLNLVGKQQYETLSSKNGNKPLKSSCFSFYKTKEHPVFEVLDMVGITHVTSLILDCSHIHDNKFRHNFKDTANRLCS